MEKCIALTAVAALLIGCSAAAGPTIDADDGSVFTVERYDLGEVALPSTADMRMVDGDLVRYGAQICDLEGESSAAPQRCDVFVQPDPNGQMIGYAVLRQTEAGVTINTHVKTNAQAGRAANGCWLGGTVYQYGSGYERAVSSSSAPFEGQMMYSAWERSPGDFLVSPIDASTPVDVDSEGAVGVWYLTHTDNKLRIAQERWNYCYSDVAVDEVFTRAISFLKRERT